MRATLFLGAFVLAALPGAGLGKDNAAVSAVELKAFELRYEAVRGPFEKFHEEFAKDLEDAEDALEVGQVRKNSRSQQSAYLRFVMMLEEDFRLLARPKDEIDERIEPSEFSIQERRKVASLRQEIRDAERARIKAELKEGRGMRSDKKVEEKISDDERSLDSLFARNVSSLQRGIAKAERELAKEKVSERREDRKVEELEENLTEWNTTLSEIHRYVYGFPAGAGFDLELGFPEDSEAGKFLAGLAEERKRLITILRGEEVDGGEGEKKGGLVGGSFLYSSNLGVVLDVSGSMTPHIEKLKEEIGETFEAPRYREVKGCRIHGARYGGLSFAALVNSTPDTMTEIEELTAVWGVDTVYWFCDLRDGFDFAGLRRLRYLLMRSGAAFHVKSMAMRPERELKPLIDDFQG